jgi:hypothetical protein
VGLQERRTVAGQALPLLTCPQARNNRCSVTTFLLSALFVLLREQAQAQDGGCVGSVSAWRRGADEVGLVREVAVVEGAACACGGGGM